MEMGGQWREPFNPPQDFGNPCMVSVLRRDSELGAKNGFGLKSTNLLPSLGQMEATVLDPEASSGEVDPSEMDPVKERRNSKCLVQA